MIERNYMDLVIFFYNPILNSPNEADIFAITRTCDRYKYSHRHQTLPPAESMVLGLAAGDLDWRDTAKREY